MVRYIYRPFSQQTFWLVIARTFQVVTPWQWANMHNTTDLNLEQQSEIQNAAAEGVQDCLVWTWICPILGTPLVYPRGPFFFFLHSSQTGGGSEDRQTNKAGLTDLHVKMMENWNNMFSLAFVCLSVCQQDYLKATEPIYIRFCGGVGAWPNEELIPFSEKDQDKQVDPGCFLFSIVSNMAR